MTDPVNTDALREVGRWLEGEDGFTFRSNGQNAIATLANEVDRLRASLAMQERVCADVLRAWDAMRSKVDNMRTVIEDAPHDPATCATWFGPQDSECTCWKADVP